MRAAVVERYGDPEVVRVVHRDDPVPRRGQALVRVHAAAVTSADARIRAARFPPGFGAPARLAFGLRRPRRPVLGGALAGEVVTLGPDADGPPPGTRVAAMNGLAMGGHAELATVAARRLVPVPDEVDLGDAAAVLFGGTTALHLLRDRVDAGTRVLINGAAGAIGTNAVQLAAAAGGEVTGVCRAANAALVTALGAAATVDHTRRAIVDLDDRFDVVLDAVGNLSLDAGRRLLAPGGVLVLAVASLRDTVRSRGDAVAGAAPERVEDIATLLDLVASDALRVVIERTFPLDDVVAAHAHVDTGRKVGNVLLHPTAG